MPIFVGNVISIGTLRLGIMVDTTGSMNFVQTLASEIRTVVKNRLNDGSIDEVVLGDFREFPSQSGFEGDYPYNIIVPLTSDPDEVDGYVLDLGSGGDEDETMWSAIVDGLIGAGNFSNGIAIIISDNEPKNPEPITGYTTSSTISACSANKIKVCGIRVVPSGLGSDRWGEIVSATDGVTVTNPGTYEYENISTTLNNLIESLLS